MFEINTTWDGKSLDHRGVKIDICASTEGARLSVDAPFFNDPGNPGGKAGQPFQELWEYEVVETFFLNDFGQYLEVELCPHGQHLVLMLKSCRNCFTDQLPLDFKSTIEGDSWHGEAVIPADYFPPRVTRFNAFAIHGSGPHRVYEALYPASDGQFSQPDFHRLELFKEFAASNLPPVNHTDDYKSAIWKSK